MSVRTSFKLLALISAMAIGGCQLFQPSQPAQSFSGTLHSVRPVGGGDPTGWVLSMGMEGMGASNMSLDVSKVQADANALDGKQVTVSARPVQGNKLEVESIGVISGSK